MKKKSLLFTTLLFLGGMAIGQSNPSFSVRISSDSILLGNAFQVSFTLENAEGVNFQAPDWSLYFDVVSGPNQSTSMSFMNGQMSRSVTYTYYLKPRDLGNFYIEPASIETPESILETDPLEVLVVPNPDGIQQNPMDNGFNTPANPFFNVPGFDGFDNLNGFDSFEGFGGFEEMRKQLEKMLEGFGGGDGNFFRMFPDDMQPMGPDSLFFQMPPGMNFFQMNPDSLFKQMPDEWKRMFPDDMQPVDPKDKKKKKRKIYKT